MVRSPRLLLSHLCSLGGLFIDMIVGKYYNLIGALIRQERRLGVLVGFSIIPVLTVNTFPS